MQSLVGQLERISGRAKFLLLAMRVSGLSSILLGVIAGAVLLDYWLRLPGPLRLVLLVAGGAGTLVAGLALVGPVLSQRFGLVSLALRLEKLHPQAAGRLASGVAFATAGPTAYPQEAESSAVGALFRQRSQSLAQGALSHNQIAALLKPGQALIHVAILLVLATVLAGAAVSAPESAGIALQRWFVPLGDARWPNRHQISSLVTQSVAPDNAPLSMGAQVTKGNRPDLRTWVVWRIKEQGPWQKALMTPQALEGHAGRYERLLDPLPGAKGLVFYFEAGDDRTPTQELTLFQPPVLKKLLARIQPPAYAQNQMAVQTNDLLDPPRPAPTLEALVGSRIQLEAQVAGAFTGPPDAGADSQEMDAWVRAAAVGLLDGADESLVAGMDLKVDYTAPAGPGRPAGLTMSWTLRRTHPLRFHLADGYGTRHEDQRLLGFEARNDRLPAASVTLPAADESVLPQARLDLGGQAQDDVAVTDLRIEARAGAGTDARIVAAAAQAGQPRATAAGVLDLAPLRLSPGQEVLVTAVVRDNYLLDGLPHEPVISAVRRIQIVAPEELARQVRVELAELRQRAIRARTDQERLTQMPADSAAARAQRGLQERVAGMDATVQSLDQRLQRNQLQDPTLKQTLQNAAQILEDAARAAQAAGGSLEQASANPTASESAVQEARAQQERTEAELDNLIELLDQGRDAEELRQRLVKLARDQAGLSQTTRENLPRTLGQSLEDLNEQERQELLKSAQQQQDLADQAQALVEGLRMAASAIGRQSEDPRDQAMAEAMRQAADTATQENLDQMMDQSAQDLAQNRLSQAQENQSASEQTLQKMLQEMGRADALRHQILQRKALELVEAIKRLHSQQEGQLERLLTVQQLQGLAEPLLGLRNNTLAVAEKARATGPETQPVAVPLEEAAVYQAQGVTLLRGQDPSTPAVETAQRQALEKLAEALRLAEALAEKLQDETSRQAMQELAKAYQKALDQEKVILDETQGLEATPPEQRQRRFRAESAALGDRQADLRLDLAKLHKKVADTVVYGSVHELLDEWASEASARLRRGQTDGATLLNEQWIVDGIESLLEGLVPPKPDESFAESQSEEDAGGGQGQAGQAPLIPPVAELKLLRLRQERLYLKTRQVDQDKALASTDRVLWLEQLSRQQGDLAQVARKLLQSLQQPSAPPAAQEKSQP